VSPIVDKAESMTTARIYGVPIIGDVDEHRVYAGLRRGAVVVAQDAAEAFAARDRCSGIDVLVGRRRDRGEQPVVEALVVALEMVVLDELRDRDADVALTERNELVEALRLDGEHEAFRDGVQVGASGRELEALDAGGAEDRAERVGEQRVAVMVRSKNCSGATDIFGDPTRVEPGAAGFHPTTASRKA
jgi:hypothetical protein